MKKKKKGDSLWRVLAGLWRGLKFVYVGYLFSFLFLKLLLLRKGTVCFAREVTMLAAWRKRIETGRDMGCGRMSVRYLYVHPDVQGRRRDDKGVKPSLVKSKSVRRSLYPSGFERLLPESSSTRTRDETQLVKNLSRLHPRLHLGCSRIDR